MDIYRALGVEPLINAAGTLTRMSGSLMWPEVTDAMMAASRHFVDMNELHEAAGRRIAELIGVEGAHVCACATAGIAVMAAACMAGTDRRKVLQLPDTTGMKHRFIAQQAHRNAFDQALRVAGGTFVDIGPDVGALEAALVDREVAGILHTFSWFNPEEALRLPQVTACAKKAGVPVIVDAAAEVPPLENLKRFLDEGADLVTFSGGKAIRGPQSSGMILGRADLIQACAANDSPNMGIGRGMKAAKEEIVGLVKAVELYVRRDHQADRAVWDGRVARIVEAVADLEHVEAWRQFPFGVGQQIPHAAIRWNEEKLGLTHEEAVARLKDGKPRIAVQLIHEPVYRFAHKTGQQIRVHPHTLREGQEGVVARRVREVLTGNGE